MTSLYVGDLHPDINDDQLRMKFSEIGPVAVAHVCRDVTSRKSLGYGYVNFEDPKDAERALEQMNYEVVMGRPIRIMWSQRDPSLRKSGLGNIFIKNLAKTIEQKELYDTFSLFGRILSCKIAMDENGNSKGYGFVHFENEECAKRAIQKVNNMSICGKVVYVGNFIPRSDRKSQNRKQKFNNIYVKNFPPETDDEKLKEMFTEFGEIKSACVMKDSEGKSKGFGFVCYLNPEHAEAAVAAMHGKEIGGRSLYASRAQRKEERQEELKLRLEKQKAERRSKYVSNVNLYVKNLDDEIDDERLKEIFSKYGPISSAKVMTDSNNRSKGFGFVCFTNPEQATKAVTEANGRVEYSKPLYVAIAQRKEDRRAELAAKHTQHLNALRSTAPPMIPALMHPTQNYFHPYPQQARLYSAPGQLMQAQPRWSRNGPLAADLSQLAMSRPPLSNYPNPNHAVAMAPQMNMNQMRSPANVFRTIVPTPMPSMTSNMMGMGPRQQQQQVANRPVLPVQPVLAGQAGALAQRPQMVPGPNQAANLRQITQSMPRSQMHQVMPNMTGAAGNVRFNQTARNVSAQSAQMAPANHQNALSALGDQTTYSIGELARLSEDDQKRALGEKLFPLIREQYPQLAHKLTGMLLGLDIPEVIHMLESKDTLQEKLQEGINVLRGNQSASDELTEEARRTTNVMNNIPGQNGDGSLQSQGQSSTDGHKPENQ
uniref:Polyadenylate-binding protein n=1 Tax=Xenopus laevis TaxID=8355 RepID=Q5U586_XENLA|nr:uncharacterized protein LOC495336 [Xenopus laevis]AAH84798.1 LOC495336 protein [Xenopus laevis]